MKKIFSTYILLVLLLVIAGCNDDSWLSLDPENVITEEQVWNDPQMIRGVLANYYDRIPQFNTLQGDGASIATGWYEFALFTNALWSGQSNRQDLRNVETYGTWWDLWDYDLIRDINLAIENIDQYATGLEPDEKNQYKAEFRFIRAWVYFQHVKINGGVPLITETIDFDFSGGQDISTVEMPRNSEKEVYNFIGRELDAIQDSLSHNAGSQTRANKFTALALKSRAMLYAASIAQHNSNMAIGAITLDDPNTGKRLVGIREANADSFYTEALEAAEEVINNSPYSLYTAQLPGDPGRNFYEAVSVKDGNNEVIFAEDFQAAADRRHLFTYENVPRPNREDNLSSSSITPGLNFVEAFPYLDGSDGELQTRDPNTGEYIYYENLDDIFDNKDGRLDGTVITPGETFRGEDVPIQRGVKIWNGTSYDTEESASYGTRFEGTEADPVDWWLTAPGGPAPAQQNITHTGFYLRKFLDEATGASTRGNASDTWWVKLRLSEMYLNAAEAAYQLSVLQGDPAMAQRAAGYINDLRDRAGFEPNTVTAANIDFDLIMNERRIELAFEGHELWDQIRWRRAHIIWDGDDNNPTANISALFPYRVYRPGHPNHGDYVFDEIEPRAPSFLNARWFQPDRYYMPIPQDAINNNNKLVQNPGY